MIQSALIPGQEPTQRKPSAMKHNIFLAFSEKSFFFLWLGEVFTLVAINLFTFYLILSVYNLTKSNTAVAAAVITVNLPAVLFGILAGAYVDRWNKKKVLINVNILRALCIAIVAIMHTSLPLIYTMSLIIYFLTQFFIPADTPIIPQVVKKEFVYSANALYGLAIYGSILIAFMFSGAIILTLGDQMSLFFFAGLLILGAICTSFVKYKNGIDNVLQKKFTPLNIKNEITAAFTLMSRTRKVYSSLFLLALVQILILIIATVTPGYANQVLHMQVEQFPLIFVTPAAIGMLLGAFILINRFHDVAKEKIVIIGLLLSGVSMMALPYGAVLASKEFVKDVNAYLPHILDITGIHLLVVLAFILGLANSLVFVPSNTLILENTSEDIRGKLYGLLNAIVGIFSLLPLIIVGGLSDLIGVNYVLTGVGICLLIIGGYEYVSHIRRK